MNKFYMQNRDEKSKHFLRLRQHTKLTRLKKFNYCEISWSDTLRRVYQASLGDGIFY